jgi:hypothetical protein
MSGDQGILSNCECGKNEVKYGGAKIITLSPV